MLVESGQRTRATWAANRSRDEGVVETHAPIFDPSPRLCQRGHSSQLKVQIVCEHEEDVGPIGSEGPMVDLGLDDRQKGPTYEREDRCLKQHATRWRVKLLVLRLRALLRLA